MFTTILFLTASFAQQVEIPPAPGAEFDDAPALPLAEFADGAIRAIGPADLGVELERADGPLIVRFPLGGQVLEPERSDEERVEVRLVGGEQLGGDVGGGSGETLTLELVGATLLPLSIDALVQIEFPGRIPSDPGTTVEAPAEGDRLFRRVGSRLDRVDGFIEGFEPEGIAFESLVGRQVIEWEDVAAVFIESIGEPDPPPEGARRFAVDLADGSRLDATYLGIDARELRLEVAGGARLALPLETVERLTTLDGRVRYVSSLKPLRVIGGSAFGDELGMVFKPAFDRAVHGAKLRAGGQRFARGIGVQAPTSIAFEIGPEWSQLGGAVAVDDSVKALGLDGSVRFRVSVDGEVVWESAVLSVSSGVVALADVELPPAVDAAPRELLLEVAMEDDLNVGDRADWLDLRLLR